jgi:hypothetical protein
MGKFVISRAPLIAWLNRRRLAQSAIGLCIKPVQRYGFYVELLDFGLARIW